MENAEQNVIGEAAYALLMRREAVTVSSLVKELSRMAENNTSPERHQEIIGAQQWLLAHRGHSEPDNRTVSPVRGMSAQSDSVRMPADEKNKK
ncbi:hypothetical protein [Pantoea eucrina]|uniref:Uncharacterized protein n=1 Tax=Pantoea eucrina TaxID=472693 RepID=A0ABU5LG39_9GAMM|nr:hypothetical protein [Pantoea eucrina]MDZ7278676.1 hypothetical protein [Pantoea eucrina]